MKDFNIKELLEQVTTNEELKLEDIPSIDLYMDQITTFIEEGLSSYKRGSDDKILTKTMINNYTKDKLIPPPEKKKYTKNHMILLIIIYHLKSILSISDINSLLSNVLKNINFNDCSEIYQIFIEIQKMESETIFNDLINNLGDFNVPVDNIKSNNKEQIKYLILVFMLIIKAEFEKRLAEKIIDTYF